MEGIKKIHALLETRVVNITADTIIRGDIDIVWAIVIDVANWPKWDPHELAARLDGPFAAGTKGWSKPRGAPPATWTITRVVHKREWASESPLPGGKLSGESKYEPLVGGRIRCARTVTVTGLLVPLFHLHFARLIRRDMLATWQALEKEAARRKLL